MRACTYVCECVFARMLVIVCVTRSLLFFVFWAKVYPKMYSGDPALDENF